MIVTVVTLTVGALLFVAFVAPGFLRDSDDAARAQRTAEAEAGDTARKISRALDGGHEATLENLLCSDAMPRVRHTVMAADSFSGVFVTVEEVDAQDGTAEAGGALYREAEKATFTLELAEWDNAWCWRDLQVEGTVQLGTGVGAWSPSEEAFLEQVGVAVNAGERRLLEQMLCESAADSATKLLEQAIADGHHFMLQETSYGWVLESADKAELLVNSRDENAPYCIRSVSYFP